MKKIMLTAWLAIIAVWLGACSGPVETLKKEGNATLISQEFLNNNVKGYEPGLPLASAPDSNFFDGAKFTGVTQTNQEDGADYQSIPLTANTFYIFQNKKDKGGKIIIPWVAKITYAGDNPQLDFQPSLKFSGSPAAKAIANNGVVPSGFEAAKGKTAVKFIIKSVHIIDYDNVEDRYAINSRYKISWDKDALGHIDEIRQFDCRNQDNPDSCTGRYSVIGRGNEAIIDVSKGWYIWPFSHDTSALNIQRWKRDDLQLDGLRLYPFHYRNYLEIDKVAEPEEEIWESAPVQSFDVKTPLAKQVKKLTHHKHKAKSVGKQTDKSAVPLGYYIPWSDLTPELQALCKQQGSKLGFITKEDLRAFGSSKLKNKYLSQDPVLLNMTQSPKI